MMGEMNSIFAKRSEANKINSDLRTRRINRSGSKASSVDSILYLQRTIGNQAVSRLIKSKALQAKLRIGQPGDVYEHEADRVADAVMRMPAPQKVSINNSRIQRASTTFEENELKRQPIEEEEEEEEKLQRQPAEEEEEEKKLQAKNVSVSNPVVDSVIENQIQCMKGGGRSLSQGERAFFEPRLGYDFSDVRVHEDAKASEAARGVNARAFTIGKDVVFNAGEYSPDNQKSQKLMAHELTHVIQQNRG
ncbi:MAG: DUF4157 domain-containing protein [Methanosarcinales archaeon]|nr:DUF4157 domain-containing protein [Methanosarcinales archaeon]